MNLKSIVIVLFMALGLNVGLVNFTSANDVCDTIYDGCLTDNPYHPEEQEAQHEAWNNSCEASFTICEEIFEEN